MLEALRASTEALESRAMRGSGGSGLSSLIESPEPEPRAPVLVLEALAVFFEKMMKCGIIFS
jgi:hypothetical protein